MKAFSEWSAATDPFFNERRVLAMDLDDTLTSSGVLPSNVHRALEDCQAKGWTTILVTGRPAGWADALIKLLPFDGIVAENGGLIFYWPHKKSLRRPRQETTKLFWNPKGYLASPPDALKSSHQKAAQKIMSEVPGCRIASDQPYRLYDLAIDFAEEVDPPLPLTAAAKIRDIFSSLGATAKVSSIHVNGWWGSFSKEDALRELVEKKWKMSLQKNVVYVGDSPNDGPLFKAAGMSVGVANVKHFAGQKDFQLPQYVTPGESSQGCLEIMKALSNLGPS